MEIIQSRMLILESDEPRVKRIKAAELLSEMGDLQKRCNDRAYCVAKCPKTSTHKQHPPVVAALNEVALEAIGKNNMHSRMEKFGGKTRSANVRGTSR
jgi:hypothetical protein